MTEEDIDKLETQIMREQYGLKGDVTNEVIKKIMSFYSVPTSSVIS
jgi:hypothetical protein